MLNQRYRCVRLSGAITMFAGTLAIRLGFPAIGWAVICLGWFMVVVGITGHWFNE